MLESVGSDASSKYTLWKLTSRFKRIVVPKSPIEHPAGGWYFSNEKKAEIFADSLEERLKPFSFTTAATRRAVELTLQMPFRMCLPTCPVTFQDVKELIKKLEIKKAPGEDVLDNRALKLLSTKGILFIVLLLNTGPLSQQLEDCAPHHCSKARKAARRGGWIQFN